MGRAGLAGIQVSDVGIEVPKQVLVIVCVCGLCI